MIDPLRLLGEASLLAIAAPGCALGPDPGCTEPVPLLGEKTDISGYVVVFHPGTAAAQMTAQLAAKHGFTPLHVYETVLQGFSAELSDAALEGIRCEPVVRQVEYEGGFTVR